jgi:hypothetical protein
MRLFFGHFPLLDTGLEGVLVVFGRGVRGQFRRCHLSVSVALIAPIAFGVKGIPIVQIASGRRQ